MSISDNELASNIGNIIRRSRVSFFSTLITIAIVLSVVVISAAEIANLRERVTTLNEQKKLLSISIGRKEEELGYLTQQAKRHRIGLRTLNDANRDLISHHYEAAIQGYKKFLDIDGESAETLNAYGYAQLRWGIAERITSRTANAQDQQALLKSASEEFAASKLAFDRAATLDKKYYSPPYLAILASFYQGQYDDATMRTSQLLKADPKAVNMLCNDEQLRQLKIPLQTILALKEISAPYTENLEANCTFLGLRRSE